jgi:hypothetical protein
VHLAATEPCAAPSLSLPPPKGEPLSEQDLINISIMSKLVTTRPQNKLVSHQVRRGAVRQAGGEQRRRSARAAPPTHSSGT